MDDLGNDQRRQPPGVRQVARLVLPAFGASALVMLIGVVLSLTHHRTLGIVFILVGAIGGFAVRARLVWRAQHGTDPRP